ncbi:DcuS/MalK family sensor histidine kinase [Priestia endophytica]|uniref:DcuS/MalK family sensor histidine kinase n=1 Tax=Priestia endophytica TaxID=135735 RepID=UPI003D288BDF
MFKHRLKLSSSIIIFVCVVVILSLFLTDTLISRTITKTIRTDQEEKAMNVARTVALSPVIREGLLHKEESKEIQEYTKDIQKATKVEFVVVIDMKGIRKSHPNPKNIGKKFSGGDEKEVLKGKETISISEGTLGMSSRSFTPVRDENGKQIGAVAVGTSLNKIEQALQKAHDSILVGSIVGLIIGVLGAILLARYIKKTLFGLEPYAIAKILEERNTMLQSAHEGIIAVDRDGKITLVNRSALRLFQRAGLSNEPIGKAVDEYLPVSKLSTMLKERQVQLDEEININGVSMLVNRVPLILEDKVVGAISTLRDKTEVNQLAEQLTGVRLYAEALRAQSHEFKNKLHVILGMTQMGYYDELSDYINQLVNHQNQEVGLVMKHIKSPALAGFIIGKLSYAREERTSLQIDSETPIPEPKSPEVTHELITIIGNLIDNAIDAVAKGERKEVTVNLHYKNNRLTIEVNDTGAGISEEVQKNLFVKGFSTKGDNRGIGLYLVERSVRELGGYIDVESTPSEGTTFVVELFYEPRGEEA